MSGFTDLRLSLQAFYHTFITQQQIINIQVHFVEQGRSCSEGDDNVVMHVCAFKSPQART